MHKTTTKKDKTLHKLRYWRNYVGLNQEDFAVLLGYTTSSYCQKELGKIDFRLSELLKILKAVNDRLAKMGHKEITLDELIK